MQRHFFCSTLLVSITLPETAPPYTVSRYELDEYEIEKAGINWDTFEGCGAYEGAVSESFEFDSYEEALEHSMELVDAELEQDLIELMGKLTFRLDGKHEVSLRVPYHLDAYDEEEEEIERRLSRFNARLAELRASGYVFCIPGWDEVAAPYRAAPELFEECFEEEGDSARGPLTRRYFVLCEDDSVEVGPECRFTGGEPDALGYQVDESVCGPFLRKYDITDEREELPVSMVLQRGEVNSLCKFDPDSGQLVSFEQLKTKDGEAFEVISLEDDEIAAPKPYEFGHWPGKAIVFQELFGEARSTLEISSQDRPSFLKLTQLVEMACRRDMAQARQVFIPFVTQAVASWPSSVRVAPVDWILRLVRGALPTSSLGMCSALHLAPALLDMTYDSNHDEDYEALLAWLEGLGPDCPALEGLSLRYVAPLKKFRSLDHKEFEVPARCHPQRSLWETELHKLLRSPLCRELEVLDLSTDRHEFDVHQARSNVEMDPFLLDVTVVLDHITSTKLRVLDVRGQCSNPGAELEGGRVHEHLEVLRMGGLFPPNRNLIESVLVASPGLKQLAIYSGPGTDIFDDDFKQLAEDSDYNPLVWNVFEGSDVESWYPNVSTIEKINASKLECLYLEPFLEGDRNGYARALAHALESTPFREGLTVERADDVVPAWHDYYEA